MNDLVVKIRSKKSVASGPAKAENSLRENVFAARGNFFAVIFKAFY